MTEPINPYASPQSEDSASLPGIVPDGTESIDLYRSTKRLGKTLRGCFWLLLISSGASVVTGSWYLATSAVSWEQENLSPAEWAELAMALVVLAAYLACVIVFCKWKYRSYRNALAFGVQRLRFSPGWAVGYYFVPIANLFQPYRAMKDIYNGSKGDDVERSAGVVASWWAGFLIMGFFDRASNRAGLRAETLADFQVSTVAEMAASVVTIIATFLAIRLVRQVDARQHQRAVALGWEETEEEHRFRI